MLLFNFTRKFYVFAMAGLPKCIDDAKVSDRTRQRRKRRHESKIVQSENVLPLPLPSLPDLTSHLDSDSSFFEVLMLSIFISFLLLLYVFSFSITKSDHYLL